MKVFRRQVGIVLTGAVGGLAGCSDGGGSSSGPSSTEDFPDPELRDTEEEWLDRTTYKLTTLVENEGVEGDILVRVSLFDAQEVVLDRQEEVVFIRSNESREVTFTFENVSDEFETWEVEWGLPDA